MFCKSIYWYIPILSVYLSVQFSFVAFCCAGWLSLLAFAFFLATGGDSGGWEFKQEICFKIRFFKVQVLQSVNLKLHKILTNFLSALSQHGGGTFSDA